MNPIACLTPQRSQSSAPLAGAVAIAASAGGIPALITLLGSLPNTFPLPIFIAQHLPRGASVLDQLLSRYSALDVSWAVQAGQPVPGHVYLVPPGTCLAVTAQGFELLPLGPKASSWLICADRLIDSMTDLYGAHCIGIVLSGALSVGVKGLRAITARGGFVMAQDRASSGCFDMPAAAIDFGKADIVMPPERLAFVLNLIAQSWCGGYST
jgi:two-component system chemotaxis response regulator CheB